MEKIFKQALTWVGAACIVAAILFAVIGSVLHQDCKLVNNLQKGIDKRDTQAIAECYEPSAREEIILYSSLSSLLGEGLNTTYDIYFAGYEDLEQKDVAGEEEVTKKVRCIFVETTGLEVSKVYSDEMEIVKIDKKEYFEY